MNYSDVDSDIDDVNFRRLNPEAKRLAHSFASVKVSNHSKIPDDVPNIVSHMKSKSRDPIDTKVHKTQLKKVFTALVEARQEEIVEMEEALSDALSELENLRKHEEDKLSRTVADLSRRFQHQLTQLQEQYARQVELLEEQTTEQLTKARDQCESSVDERTRALMQELRASGRMGSQVAAALRGRMGGGQPGGLGTNIKKFDLRSESGPFAGILDGINGGVRIRRPISMFDYRDELGRPLMPAPVPGSSYRRDGSGSPGRNAQAKDGERGGGRAVGGERGGGKKRGGGERGGEGKGWYENNASWNRKPPPISSSKDSSSNPTKHLVLINNQSSYELPSNRLARRAATAAALREEENARNGVMLSQTRMTSGAFVNEGEDPRGVHSSSSSSLFSSESEPYDNEDDDLDFNYDPEEGLRRRIHAYAFSGSAAQKRRAQAAVGSASSTRSSIISNGSKSSVRAKSTTGSYFAGSHLAGSHLAGSIVGTPRGGGSGRLQERRGGGKRRRRVFRRIVVHRYSVFEGFQCSRVGVFGGGGWGRE